MKKRDSKRSVSKNVTTNKRNKTERETQTPKIKKKKNRKIIITQKQNKKKQKRNVSMFLTNLWII